MSRPIKHADFKVAQELAPAPQLKPNVRQDIETRHFDLPVAIHSCGSSSWAFDDFIEMGIDVVDTLQPEARDMAPATLKARFGDRLAFHGCISTAGPVAKGSVEETVDDVRQILENNIRELRAAAGAEQGGAGAQQADAVSDRHGSRHRLASFTARGNGGAH